MDPSDPNSTAVLQENLRLMSEFKDIMEDISKQRESTIASLREEIKEKQKKLALADDDAKKATLSAETQQLKLELLARENEQLEENIASVEGIADKSEEQVRLLEQAYAKLSKNKQEAGEVAKKLSEGTKEMEKASKEAGTFGDRLIQAGKNVNSIFSQLGGIKDKVMSIRNDFSAMSTGFESPLSVLTDYGKMKAALQASALEARNASSSVVNSTGVVLGAQRAVLSQGLGGYAIGNKELAASFSDLYNNMNQFSNLNIATQKELVGSAAKMKNLGVETKVFAQGLQILNTTLGMSASKSNETLNSIAQAARQAGIAPQKMLADFSAHMGNLAVYGTKGVDVFIAMEKQSKALGVEMGRLNEMFGNAFDTFEGAAEKAGGLNAILGGDFLNATEMMNASEEERIQLVKEAMEASGQSFDTMDKYQQKAIAQRLGFKDVGEAKNFFSKSTSQMQEEMSKSEKTVGSLDKAQRAGADATRLNELAIQGLAQTQRKHAEEMNKSLGVIDKFIKDHQELFGTLTMVSGVLGPLSGMFAPFIGIMQMLGAGIKGTLLGIGAAFKGFMSIFKKGAGDASKASGPASKAISRIGTAVAQTVKKISGPQIILGMLALAAVIWVIGESISKASEGLAKLVASFAGLTGPQVAGAVAALVVVMGGFIAIIAVLGAIMLAGPGAAAAIGILAIAAAMWILSDALVRSTDSLLILKPVIIEMGKVIMDGLVRMFDRLMQAFEKIVPVIINFVEKVLNKIFDVLIKLVDVFGNVLIKAIDGFIEALKIVASLVKDVVLGIFDRIITLANMSNVKEKLYDLAKGLLAVAGALVVLGGGSLVGALFQGIGSMFSSLTGTAGTSTSSIDGVTSSLTKLAAVMNTMPDAEIKLKHNTEFIQKVKTANPTDYQAATTFMERGKEFYQAQMISKDADKDALINALKVIFGKQETKPGEEPEGLQIKLVVGDKELRAALNGINLGQLGR